MYKINLFQDLQPKLSVLLPPLKAFVKGEAEREQPIKITPKIRIAIGFSGFQISCIKASLLAGGDAFNIRLHLIRSPSYTRSATSRSTS